MKKAREERGRPSGSWEAEAALLSGIDLSSLQHDQELLMSISADFIYPMLEPQETSTEKGKTAAKDPDCNCNPLTAAGRLPTNEELLSSGQFTQDIGSGRMNFPVPNRTLREYSYTALLRYTDPEKKQIITINSAHSLRGSEPQSLIQFEDLSAVLQNDCNIVDQIVGSLEEPMAGSSSTLTGEFGATAGASASNGIMGGSIGASGGYASSKSQAQQGSGRGLSQFFAESLKQKIQQNASTFRAMNASVVASVDENQSYRLETEVVANQNHCHSLTMMYFEVLRHYAIYQSLVDVEECVFVPLLMSRFSIENLSRWADVLEVCLLHLHANTWTRPAAYGFPIAPAAYPLKGAFDAVERVQTQ
ncbi:hypothetical protein BCR34DRAFT_600653 [Clohesyomyces aquaticus]|uniref:Uncharacterized protein n=1 Tax=Clohesyomyces aquaticus TaxID=1231657 RepID=A0A1Y1ZQC6_9PLEO|nr:hypothetical protein BCR34DRAFT_600653 [Clohesyomyces aquaticus]